MGCSSSKPDASSSAVSPVRRARARRPSFPVVGRGGSPSSSLSSSLSRPCLLTSFDFFSCPSYYLSLPPFIPTHHRMDDIVSAFAHTARVAGTMTKKRIHHRSD